MSLIILEGVDRVGKSTVASHFESQGFEIVHLSAPPKELSEPGYTGPSYLDMMIDLVSEAAHKDIILDRSAYGELVWPNVYGRKAMLTEDDIDVLREIEDSVGVKRIMMFDPNVEAHWQRCVDNKEPLTKPQFVKARSLFSQIAHKYGFELVTLPAFVKEFNLDPSLLNKEKAKENNEPEIEQRNNSESAPSSSNVKTTKKTAEQLKLEKANAINSILEKRILKSKGEAFDELESDIRNFLNNKLGKLLGGGSETESLTKEELAFFKMMYKRAIEKQ
jgi:thymidylate kinase